MYDFFLLTKDDLVELQLPIGVRNRIQAFQKHLADEGILSGRNIMGSAQDASINLDIEEVVKRVARSETATPNMNLRQTQNTTFQNTNASIDLKGRGTSGAPGNATVGDSILQMAGEMSIYPNQRGV